MLYVSLAQKIKKYEQHIILFLKCIGVEDLNSGTKVIKVRYILCYRNF